MLQHSAGVLASSAVKSCPAKSVFAKVVHAGGGGGGGAGGGRGAGP
eukprot:SAG22_NODE_162_length_16848_cov_16.978267_1_plen_45_part_10